MNAAEQTALDAAHDAPYSAARKAEGSEKHSMRGIVSMGNISPAEYKAPAASVKNNQSLNRGEDILR
jgi:hypothetical protein